MMLSGHQVVSYLFIFLLSFTLVSAVGIDNPNLPLVRVEEPINYSEIPTVNQSDFWVTNEGVLDNVADILHNWLDATSLLWSNAGHTIDAAIEMNANPIDNVSHVQFDPAGDGCVDEFCLEVDGDQGALQYTLPGGNVVNQIGFETHLGGGRVRNTEAFTIDNCKVVYLSGATGGVPEIKLPGTEKGYRIAQATVGLATESIASNQQGYVTIQGIVRDCDTSGFSAGQGLYLSTEGNLTNIPPTGNGTIFIGVVNRVHATEGEINVLIDKIPSIGDVLYSRNNADGLQLRNISNGTDTADAVNLGQLQSVNNSIGSAIQNNTEDGYVYKGDFQTSQNDFNWSVTDDGANQMFNFPDVGGANYVELATTGGFFQLYGNPNPSNDYLLATITETQGADTELNFYEGGTGHNRFWNSGSARFGGGADYLCSNLTTDVDCDTSGTGADVVVEDDIWFGGNIIGNGSQLTDLPSPDLSAYWKSDGTSTATGDWDIDSNGFTTTGLGTFGSLMIDKIDIDNNIIETEDEAAGSGTTATDLTLSGGDGGSITSGSTAAGHGADITISPGKGGATQAPATGVAGDSGDLNVVLQTGGVANGVAGDGGSFSLTSGAGGAGGTPGNAGTITMTSGTGPGGLGAGGVGGDFTMTSGDGGDSSFQSGGDGGDFFMSGGDGGNKGQFGTKAGDGGSIYLSGGVDGIGGGSSDGFVVFQTGTQIADNLEMCFGTADDGCIDYDGTNLVFNTQKVGSGLAYFSNNISTTGVVTRTYTTDLTDEEAYNLVEYATENFYKNGVRNYSAWGECYAPHPISDKTRPETTTYQREICSAEMINLTDENNNTLFYTLTYTHEDGTVYSEQFPQQEPTGNISCEMKTYERTIYPHQTMIEGIDLECKQTMMNKADKHRVNTKIILANEIHTNTTKDLDTIAKIENFRDTLKTKTFQQVKDFVVDATGKLSDNILMDTELSEYGSYDLGAIAHFNRAMVIFLMKENLNQQEEIQELKDKEAQRDACWDLNTQAEIIACQRAI